MVHHAEFKFSPFVLDEKVVAIGVADNEEKSGLVPVAHVKVILAAPFVACATTTWMLPPNVAPWATIKRAVDAAAITLLLPATPHMTVLPFHEFVLLPAAKPRIPTVVVEVVEKGEDDVVIWKWADATCAHSGLRNVIIK